jgi:hypothetical protein
MFPRIAGVRHVRDYVLEIEFRNGERAQLDFRDIVVGRGGVFTELEDPETFRGVEVDREAGTLVWPNGVDMCPDVLYGRATGTPIPEP